MNKLYYCTIFLLFSLMYVKPLHSSIINIQGLNSPSVYSMSSLYMSTVSNRAVWQNVQISSVPGWIESVFITRAGTGTATIELFDAYVSTLSGSARRISGLIDGTLTGKVADGVYYSSGIIINVNTPNGSLSPDITIYFRER